MVKRKLRRITDDVTTEPDEGGQINGPRVFPLFFFLKKMTLFNAMGLGVVIGNYGLPKY